MEPSPKIEPSGTYARGRWSVYGSGGIYDRLERWTDFWLTARPRFIGAAPPACHGPNRYFAVVHALDVEHIGVPAEATPAFLGFTIAGHILGRAVVTATAEIPA